MGLRGWSEWVEGVATGEVGVRSGGRKGVRIKWVGVGGGGKGLVRWSLE